jgi:hypothetical protein
MIRYLQTYVGPLKVKAGGEFLVSVPDKEATHMWIFFNGIV